MLKISATQLEAYRRYLNDKLSINQLVETWTSKTQPTLKMRAGSVFHTKLQGMQHEDEKNFVFDEAEVAEAKSKVSPLSQLFEYKLRVPITTKHGVVMFTGVADQIVGNQVCEFKTTYSSFSFDQYCESMQWRAYCYLFGVEQVKYQVWSLTEPKNEGEIIRVKDYNSFTMYSNSCTEHEFLNMLEKAVDTMHLLKLDKHDSLQYA